MPDQPGSRVYGSGCKGRRFGSDEERMSSTTRAGLVVSVWNIDHGRDRTTRCFPPSSDQGRPSRGRRSMWDVDARWLIGRRDDDLHRWVRQSTRLPSRRLFEAKRNSDTSFQLPRSSSRYDCAHRLHCLPYEGLKQEVRECWYGILVARQCQCALHIAFL